jgi:hypothetical protein
MTDCRIGAGQRCGHARSASDRRADSIAVTVVSVSAHKWPPAQKRPPTPEWDDRFVMYQDSADDGVSAPSLCYYLSFTVTPMLTAADPAPASAYSARFGFRK